MKVLIAAALLCCCHAAVIFTPRNPDDVGAAVSFNSQDGLGTYDFGYSEGHPSGATFRRESGDALGNKFGSFGLRDADGRLRVVRYVADANGFRADVTSNEPGVAPQDPASATINKPAIVPAPVVAVPPPPPPVFYPPPPARPLPPPPPVFYPPPPARPLPPPPQYNYAYNVAPVAALPPPPPPAYYRPAPPPVVAPVALPPPPPVVATPKGFAPYAVPPPPPPPAYINSVVPAKGYVSPIRSVPSFIPPFAAVPPQFALLGAKPSYQVLGAPFNAYLV